MTGRAESVDSAVDGVGEETAVATAVAMVDAVATAAARAARGETEVLVAVVGWEADSAHHRLPHSSPK